MNDSEIRPRNATIVAVVALLILVLALLTACGGGERPEPEIRTVEVRVPVVQPCEAAQRLGQAPTYADTDEALRAAPNLFEQVKLLLAGREVRNPRLQALENAVQACR